MKGIYIGGRIMELKEIVEKLKSLKDEMTNLFERLYKEQKGVDSEEQEERWCELDNQIDSLGEALSCVEDALDSIAISDED